MHSYSVILKALRDEGLKVIEVPGARNRCRCHNGGHRLGGPFARAWAPTGDTMVHITAGDRGSRTALQYIADIINGDPGVPYKANFIPDEDGTVYLNSVGRCNHAGTGGSGALARVRSQSLPLSGWIGTLRGHDTDLNTWVYGIENIAAHTMTPEQRDASVRICAAMARLSGRTGQGTPGHGETSDQRGFADPNLDMGQFRADVMARVRTAPSNSTSDDGIFGMTNRLHYYNGNDRVLAAKKISLIHIDSKSKDRVTFVSGPSDCTVGVNVQLKGMKPGESCSVRLTTKNMVTRRYSTQVMEDLVADERGNVKATVPWSGYVPAGRRLRVTIYPDTENNPTLQYVQAFGFTS